MIKARLQIENGEICDITNTYGLVYLKADKRFASPIKDYEQTAYPEQPGYNVSPKFDEERADIVQNIAFGSSAVFCLVLCSSVDKSSIIMTFLTADGWGKMV